MNKLTVLTGALLVLTGVVAYLATARVSVTALIPAFAGGLILLCALIALRPGLHRHGIHAALVIALLGAVGSFSNAAKLGQLVTGTAERPGAIAASAMMLLLCANYVAAGVYSFVSARKRRKPA